MVYSARTIAKLTEQKLTVKHVRIEFCETSRDKPTAKTPTPAYRVTRMRSGSQFLGAPAFLLLPSASAARGPAQRFRIGL